MVFKYEVLKQTRSEVTNPVPKAIYFFLNHPNKNSIKRRQFRGRLYEENCPALLEQN